MRLMRVPQGGGTPERLVAERGSVGAWTLAADGTVVYAFTSPASPGGVVAACAVGQARAMTTLNREVLGARDDRRGRGVHVPQLRWHGGRGVPDQAGRSRRRARSTRSSR